MDSSQIKQEQQDGDDPINARGSSSGPSKPDSAESKSSTASSTRSSTDDKNLFKRQESTFDVVSIYCDGVYESVARCNATLLARGSRYFARKLFVTPGFTRNKELCCIVKDVEPHVLKLLVRFCKQPDKLPVDTTKDSPDDLLELARGAKTLDFDYLLALCETQLMYVYLRPDNIDVMYEASQNLNFKSLEVSILMMLIKRTDEVVTSECWPRVHNQMLSMLLDQEELHLQREVDVLRAVVEWGLGGRVLPLIDNPNAENEGDSLLRAKVLKYLGHIRIYTFTFEDIGILWQDNKFWGLINAEECIYIFYIKVGNTDTGKPQIFSKCSRKRNFTKEIEN